MIHRYALCTKTLPAALKSVLDVVALVNFVKANPLNTRMLRLLCQELNAELETLLLHTVRSEMAVQGDSASSS